MRSGRPCCLSKWSIWLRALAPAHTWAQRRGPQTGRHRLFGPYVIGVELASMLLLAGLVGAYHLGRPEPENSWRVDMSRYR